MRWAVAFAVLIALPVAMPGGAWAQPAGIVLQYGETTSDRVERARPEDAGTGLTPAENVDNVQFLNHSDHIEAALCRGFGVSIAVPIRPGVAAPGQLTVRVHHPRLTRPDGVAAEDASFPTSNSGYAYAGFTFDHVWEMQAGVWEIAFFDGDKLLASQSFTVTLPASGKVESVCDGAATS